MPYVNGSKLSESAREEVLSKFTYRWTVENERRARSWYSDGNVQPPRISLISDAEWLAQHAFRVIKDGTRLDARQQFAKPACMADDWQPAGNGEPRGDNNDLHR